MLYIKFHRKALAVWVLFLITTIAWANPGKMTSASGMVSDIDGVFQISSKEPLKVLQFSYVGCDTEQVQLKAGIKNDGLEVALMPTTFELEEVVIRPKRERYRRKNNPAVKLIRNVIARKDSNRLEAALPISLSIVYKPILKLIAFGATDNNSLFGGNSKIDSQLALKPNGHIFNSLMSNDILSVGTIKLLRI